MDSSRDRQVVGAVLASLRLAARQIAIVWSGSAVMANAQPEDFDIAKSILSELTESLADVGATLGNLKHLVVVLT